MPAARRANARLMASSFCRRKLLSRSTVCVSVIGEITAVSGALSLVDLTSSSRHAYDLAPAGDDDVLRRAADHPLVVAGSTVSPAASATSCRSVGSTLG